jgi:pentatricopeptide repeat protein
MRLTQNAVVLIVVALVVDETNSFLRSSTCLRHFAKGRNYQHSTFWRAHTNKKNDANGKTQHRQNISTRAAADFNQQLQLVLKVDPFRAEQAEKDLLQRIDTHNDDGFDVVSFNIVLQAWGRQQSVVAAKRADALFQKLKTVKQPDSYSYAAILNALAKSKGGRKAALRAQELVEEMEASGMAITTDVCHNTLMNTWAGLPDGGEKCGRILEYLEHNSLASIFSYNACIKAWMRTKDPQKAGPEASKILDRLKVLCETNPSIKPDKVTYTSTINAWVPHQDPIRAAQKADAILQEMELLALTNPGKGPDIIAYTTVLTAMAKAGNPDAAADILLRMEKYGSEPANVPFCNALINLFAKSKKDGKSAEAVLRHMERQGLQPNKITYSAVIATFANHGEIDKAMMLLDELQERWVQSGDDCFLPNAQIFVSVLYALSNSGTSDAIGKGIQLLERLKVLYEQNHRDPDLAPNRIIYSQLFQILCHTDDSELTSTRAMELIEEMKAMHRSGYAPNVEPDASIYAYVVMALTKSGSVNAADQAMGILDQVETKYAENASPIFQPTPLLYSAVLQACAKSCTLEGARKAETLLRRNLDLYAQGKEFARPTTQCFNAVIDAYARSGTPNAADEAEAILNELESSPIAQPNTRSYNAVILALKNSEASPIRAENVLKRMSSRSKNGDISCRPDRVSINSVIALLAKHGMASRALEFLGFLNETFEKSGDVSFMPDLFTYNSILDAFSRSGWVDAGPRANELYQRMILSKEDGGLGIKPDAVTFASLRHAWSKTEGGEGEANRMHQAMENAKASQQQLQAIQEFE